MFEKIQANKKTLQRQITGVALDSCIVGSIVYFNSEGKMQKTFNGIIKDFEASESGIFQEMQIEN